MDDQLEGSRVYAETLTFFMKSEQVILCVRPNDDMCSMSPHLYYSRVRFENLPNSKIIVWYMVSCNYIQTISP